MATPRCSPNLRSQAIHELLEMNGGVDAVRKMARNIVDTKGNGLGLNTQVRESMKPNWQRALLQIRVNGLLSSPKTHVVNITSNALVAVMAIPEHALTATFSKAFHGGDVSMGEVAAHTHGLFQGVNDGLKLLRLGAKAGDDHQVADLFELYRPNENMYVDHLVPELVGADTGSAFGKGLAYAGKTLNVPTAMLGKADDFFKSVGYRMELNKLAHRTAKNEGLEGDAFISRMNDIVNDPPESLKMDAFEVSRYQTFTNDLGEQGQNMQKLINSNVYAKIVIPFFRTPVNILKFSLARTPLALLHKGIRADIRAGGTRAAQAEARIALGTMSMMWAFSMAQSNRITGAGPMNDNQKKNMRRAGWQPYSIKIGERSYAYNRLEPIGTLLGFGADLSEMMAGLSTEEAETAVMAGAMSMAQNLASKTYASGLFDFMAAFDDGNYKSNMKKYFINQSFTFVPYSSLSRNLNRADDPVLRDTKALEDDPTAQLVSEFINQFRKNIPGMSDVLPERRDLWGEIIDLSSDYGYLYDFASPIASRLHDPSAVDQAIIDNKISVSMPQRSIQGVKLSPEQYAEYTEKSGKAAKGRLDKIVRSSMFKGMSDGPEGMKSQIIKKIINDSRKAVAAEMIGKSDDLQTSIFKQKLEKQKTLVGN